MLLHRPLSLALLIFFFFFPLARAAYEIVNFGAKPGGTVDASNALRRAWSSACSSATPATVHVPKGTFLLHSVILSGPCKRFVTLWIEGTFVAPSNYALMPSKWITITKVNGLRITGGTLDGQGNALWACKHARRSCPHGTDTLAIGNSKNVEIIGLSSINSKLFHISIYKTENVALRGLKIVAPEASPNTDGIHVQMSRGVTITGSSIKTGDDCISIGPGSTNMWIEGITCGPGHGISIGSLGRSLQEEGVKNITVKTAEFTGTQNGLRIKAWARDSTGFVNGVSFQHAVMKNVENPIVIDQNYCPSSHGCPSQASGIKINQVQFWDIKGTSAKKVAVTLDCSPRNPCRGISLRDIKLTYNGGPAKSFCCHASGTTMGVVDPSGCL
ncbi:unnamed protein product [Spirodela intermedia]|uniref:Exopolygalacturonase n=1 Tax=Spirodela intermedia TaxID=51605 RepID=A0A7I8KHQ7_SPIIN|nr:unnamed protein product [Spirodela intermedia]